MFVGAPILFRVVKYVPRKSTDVDDEWTHWRVMVQRFRYDDCATRNVKIFIYKARRKRKDRYFWQKENPVACFEISMGNVNFPNDLRRMRTPHENDEKVVKAELRQAVRYVAKFLLNESIPYVNDHVRWAFLKTDAELTADQKT